MLLTQPRCHFCQSLILDPVNSGCLLMNKVVLFAFTVLATVVSVCGEEVRAVPEQLVGTYSRGLPDIVSWTLDLKPSGEYSHASHGCFGIMGTSTGTWRLRGHLIELVPAKESGKASHPRQLHLIRKNGSFVFVADLNDSYFREYGADEFSAFHQQEIRKPAK
jgi:hypothetical protein